MCVYAYVSVCVFVYNDIAFLSISEALKRQSDDILSLCLASRLSLNYLNKVETKRNTCITKTETKIEIEIEIDTETETETEIDTIYIYSIYISLNRCAFFFFSAE